MNHSVYSADKATHLKVVISALLVSIAIMATTLAARLTHPEINVQANATQAAYKPHRGSAVSEVARVDKHPISLNEGRTSE